MQHEWILDVIADVRSFARQNNLPDLASHMDTAWLMASVEISSLSGDEAGNERRAAATFGESAAVN